MSWFSIVERFRTHQCQTFRRMGDCGCGSGRGYNPCQRAEDYAVAAENISIGRAALHTIEEMLKYLANKVCRKSDCTHRGCAHTAECCEFLTAQLSVRKAA